MDLLLESRADPTRSSETGSFPLQLASFLGEEGDSFFGGMESWGDEVYWMYVIYIITHTYIYYEYIYM